MIIEVPICIFPSIYIYISVSNLQEDPSHVSMDWILRKVELYIEQDNDKNATYIVDYVPNLKYLLRISDITKDCKDAMNKFEEGVRFCNCCQIHSY